MENKKEEIIIEDVKLEDTPAEVEGVNEGVQLKDEAPNKEEPVLTLEMVATGVLERLSEIYASIEKQVSILGEKHRPVITEFFKKIIVNTLSSFQFETGIKKWEMMLLFEVDRNIVNANSPYKLSPVLRISSLSIFGQEIKEELVNTGDTDTFKGYISVPLRSQIFDGFLIKECIDIKGNEVKLEEKK